jgi:hypothetical protein
MLHGGRVSGVGRAVAFSTPPPLVGAGLDRIVHAWVTKGTRPVDVAARATLRLDLAETARRAPCDRIARGVTGYCDIRQPTRVNSEPAAEIDRRTHVEVPRWPGRLRFKIDRRIRAGYLATF